MSECRAIALWHATAAVKLALHSFLPYVALVFAPYFFVIQTGSQGLFQGRNALLPRWAPLNGWSRPHLWVSSLHSHTVCGGLPLVAVRYRCGCFFFSCHSVVKVQSESHRYITPFTLSFFPLAIQKHRPIFGSVRGSFLTIAFPPHYQALLTFVPFFFLLHNTVFTIQDIQTMTKPQQAIPPVRSHFLEPSPMKI